MSDHLECPCGKSVKPTNEGKWWKHAALGSKEVCDYSGTVITEEQWNGSTSTGAASPTVMSAPPPSADAKERAGYATSSTPSSPATPEEAEGTPVSTTAPASPALPGVTEYATVLDAMSAEQLAAYRATVEAKLTPFSQPAPVDDCPCTTTYGKINCQGTCGPEQPTIFSQPAGRRSEEPAVPMTDLGKELTARFKEIFYAYDNRRSADNRSAQVTMGPSEMGSVCDRRLALSLMRMPSVNPGGDGWAAFVGTAIHAALAEMFLWANAGTGRFSVETPLEFDSKYVPKGTADLIDRVLFMLDDHKCQGRWSRSKLRSQGPSQLYRIQAHVYAFGARQKGEKIEHVAIISWPRDEATLDDLYVWTEPYRPDLVQKAFERVDRIGAEVEAKQKELIETYGVPAKDERQLLQIKARVGHDYGIDTEGCKYCPFYFPGARSILDGCNGKR